MRAEEQYGEGGYRCEFFNPDTTVDGRVRRPCSFPIPDIGSGNYEPVEGQALPPPVTNYGATGR